MPMFILYLIKDFVGLIRVSNFKTFKNKIKCKFRKYFFKYILKSLIYPFMLITILKQKSGSCYTEILWFTKHACLPLPKELENTDCSVTDPTSGHTFNFLPLASLKLPV